MEETKEVQKKRSTLESIILIIFFLLYSATLYIQINLILSAQDSLTQAQLNLVYFALIVTVLALIMLIGLWFLKKWAAQGLIFVLVVGAFVQSIAQRSPDQSLIQASLFGLLSAAIMFVIVWFVFLKNYWKKLD